MRLFGYVGQRVLLTIPVVVSVVTAIFIIVRVLPGDPAQVALGENASPVAVETLRAKLGLDEPLPQQYARFMTGLVRGDLGVSMINGSPVRDQIAYNLPFTLELAGTALLVGTLAGVPLGALTAARRNRAADHLVRVVSLAAIGTPAFFLGSVLIIVFGVQLAWLPGIGGGDPGSARDVAAHLVLPALTLGLIMLASVARITRSATLSVLSQEYVRTARAKGLPESAVVFMHALRPALLPAVSLSGAWAVALIGDSVTTELVFARPGLGKLLVGAVLQRDYTALQSIMVAYTVFVVGINLLTELAYGIVDPRVRVRA